MSNSIGDLNNSGLKGNNWPWQYRVLLGLDGILNALQNNGEDFEAAYVVEKCPGPPPTERVLLEVRIWDTTTNTWGTIRYYLPGSNTPIAGPVPAAGCTLEYVDASNIRPLTCTDQITLCHLGNPVDPGNPLPNALYDITGNAITTTSFPLTSQLGLDVNVVNEVNIRSLTCTDKVSLCFNDGVSDVTVSSTNPLPVNATITVPNLNCDTDNVAICDGTNSLVIDSNGSINSNLYAQDAGTGLQEPLSLTALGYANALDVYLQGPKGVQANCADAISTALCQTQENILTDIKTAVQGTLAANTDGVGIFGTEDGTNWNAVEVDSNGHVTTNATIVGPIGSQACTTSVSVALCTDQAQNLADIKTAVATPFAMNVDSVNVPNGVTGDLDLPISIKSITFYSTGTAPVTLSVNGGTTTFPLAPGTSLNLDPGNPVAYYDGVGFQYNTTTPGATLLIIYNYL